MYLASTTDGDSIANILPPNVWLRVLIGLGLVTVLFTIVSLPQIISEIKCKKAKNSLAKDNENEAQSSLADTQ